MRLEVEQKHRVADAAALEAVLNGRGVVLGPPMEQVDQYFAHPSRDFAKTDEALRIRTFAGGSYVTYKGPKLDTQTKTRRELELPLEKTDVEGTRFGELLIALGFRPVATVRKKRRHFTIHHAGRDVDGAVDDVEGLGTFIELELLADDSTLEKACEVILSLEADLNLGESERRSYLEMLLSRSV